MCSPGTTIRTDLARSSSLCQRPGTATRAIKGRYPTASVIRRGDIDGQRRADHVGRVRDPRQDAHHHQGGQYALEPVIRFLQSDDRDVGEAARPECRETPMVLEIGKAHLLPAKGYAPSQEAPRRLLAWSRRTLLLDRKRERLRNSADVASA